MAVEGFKHSMGLAFLMITDFWKLVSDISPPRGHSETKYQSRFVAFRRLNAQCSREWAPTCSGNNILVKGVESLQTGSPSAVAVRNGFSSSIRATREAQEKEHRLLHQGPGCALPENHTYPEMEVLE